jgi:hypothetical protein
MTNSTENKDLLTNQEFAKLVIELEARQNELAVRLARLEGVVQVTVPLSQLPL